jgi:heme-degrading monooxygenase HmoA
MNRGKKIGLTVLVASVVGTGVAFARGQDSKQKTEDSKESVMTRLMQMPETIKKTPGCLGVEMARTFSGKMVIFAWFENKKAVLNWYNSQMHQELMKVAGPPSHPPLHAIKDPRAPVMVIASLTLDNRGSAAGASLPVKQIAIELYTPLPGGAAFNGRFAPESLKVKEMTISKQ